MEGSGVAHAAQQLYFIRAIQTDEPQQHPFRGVSGGLAFSATEAPKLDWERLDSTHLFTSVGSQESLYLSVTQFPHLPNGSSDGFLPL